MRNLAAQTLAEITVSLGLIITVLVGLVILGKVGLKSSAYTASRSEAAKYAAAAVDAVKYVRDTCPSELPGPSTLCYTLSADATSCVNILSQIACPSDYNYDNMSSIAWDEFKRDDATHPFKRFIMVEKTSSTLLDVTAGVSWPAPAGSEVVNRVMLSARLSTGVL